LLINPNEGLCSTVQKEEIIMTRVNAISRILATGLMSLACQISLAGSITLSPGSSIVIDPGEQTTVTCSGSGGIPGGSQMSIICDCELSGQFINLTANYYSNGKYVREVVLSQFDAYYGGQDNARNQCRSALATNALCKGN
jgi:hypothetical protein